MIGEEADAAEAEVGEDLGADAGLVLSGLVRVSGGEAGEVGAVGEDARAVEAESGAGVMQVDEDAGAGLGDGGERVLEARAAMAGAGSE